MVLALQLVPSLIPTVALVLPTERPVPPVREILYLSEPLVLLVVSPRVPRLVMVLIRSLLVEMVISTLLPPEPLPPLVPLVTPIADSVLVLSNVLPVTRDLLPEMTGLVTTGMPLPPLVRPVPPPPTPSIVTLPVTPLSVLPDTSLLTSSVRPLSPDVPLTLLTLLVRSSVLLVLPVNITMVLLILVLNTRMLISVLLPQSMLLLMVVPLLVVLPVLPDMLSLTLQLVWVVGLLIPRPPP